MKVRLEIINDDGTKKASAEFGIADRHSQLAFLNIYADETRTISEPSSNSPNMMQNALAPSNTQENIAGQNVYQPQFVQQPPVISQQPAQQVNQSQQYQQQYSEMPVQQTQIPAQPVSPQTQQFRQAYAPQPGQNSVPNTINDYQLPPQYIQPNTLPPVGVQQYGYGQPTPPLSSTVRQTMNPNQQMMSAVPNIEAPLQVQRQAAPQRKVPSLHDRMNDNSLTINERLELFLKYEYPRIWFSSQDIQKQYERIYGEIKQSTVSTYLSRMFRKNILARRGNRTQREYRYIADELEPESDMGIDQMASMPQDYRFQY
ncbi:MAG: hypothetical protein PWQ75_1046 [Methanolobus sp.]|jgi:hypothetical protein|uniref:hypothetical protein n=1 Tax=Methanolobus sp. TaxID=1874737 RepID=UPI0024ABE543|nr:hypothetical protein [Methanolobus sp.]MDI3485592.1 hypothetical protein [Methanolobus sp.]MDK2831294.1 hypothetical protein [Methanolobus sp.]